MRIAWMVPLMLVGFASGALAQDGAFKVQDQLPEDFNLFVEIDGVAGFLAAAEGGSAKPLLDGIREFIAKQSGGKDLVAMAAKELGFDPLAFIRQAKGQLAFAGRYEVSLEDGDMKWLLTLDVADAELAEQTLQKLKTKIKGAEPILGRRGGVLWLAGDRVAADLLAAARPAKPLSGGARFIEARKLMGPGRAFAFANLEPLTALIEEIPEPLAVEMLKDFGLDGVRGYTGSASFEKEAVEIRQALLLAPKSGGLLGKLAAQSNALIDLAGLPARSGYALRYPPAAMAAFLEFYENLPEEAGLGQVLDMLRMVESQTKGKRPIVQYLVNEGDASVGVMEMEDPKAHHEAMQEFVTTLLGLEFTQSTQGDLSLATLQGEGPELEAMASARILGYGGDRSYQGPTVEAVVAVHRGLKEKKYGSLTESKALAALVGKRALSGWGLTYLDCKEILPFFKKQLGALGPAMPFPPEFTEGLDAASALLERAGVGYDVVSSRDGHLVLESRSTAGLTPAGTSWVALVAAIAIPGVMRANEAVAGTNCGSNLSHMIKATYNWSIIKGDPEGSFPKELGHAFWARIAKDDEFPAESLKCPVTGRRYRGPASDATLMHHTDAIGACIHDDEVVWVKKTGDVHRAPRQTERAIKALSTTTLFSGWGEAGAEWRYRPEHAGGKPVTLKSAGNDTFEFSGEGLPKDVPTTIAVRASGARILKRGTGDTVPPLSAADEAEVKRLLKLLQSDDAGARDEATQGLSERYPIGRKLIEESLKSQADPETKLRLEKIRAAAAEHMPALVPYPVTAGATWKNAYGDACEAVEEGTIETGIGPERGWKIRVTAPSGAYELWWSEELGIPLAIRREGAGWILEKAPEGR